MNRLVMLAMSLSMSACAGFLAPVDQPTAEQLREEVLVYTDSALEGMTYKRIQQVKATSCKNEVWDPDPSEDDAMNRLREKVSSVGGNGIANLRCEAAKETNYRGKCWTSITCYASAIKVDRNSAKSE